MLNLLQELYAGKPALTEHRYGDGIAYYVCADFEEAFYADLCRRVALSAGIELLWQGLPEGAEVYFFPFICNLLHNKLS